MEFMVYIGLGIGCQASTKKKGGGGVWTEGIDRKTDTDTQANIHSRNVASG